MSITATISQVNNLSASTASQQKEIGAQSVRVGAGNFKLGDLSDVNTSAQADGASMVFDASQGQFIIRTVTANEITFAGHNTVTATNINDAIKQLADQQFRGTTAPAAGTANLGEGDLFYDTDDNQLKVYRETSTGVFAFVPIMVGNISPDSDTLDAGSF